MKSFFIIVAILKMSSGTEVGKGQKHAAILVEGRSVVVPLLDLGVLCAEQLMERQKRAAVETTTRASGFFDRILQVRDQTPIYPKRESADSLVESIVRGMSHSDPGLLLRLRDRIRKFEANKARPRPSVDSRPIFQFFNVTKISVGPADYEEEQETPERRNIGRDEKACENKEEEATGKPQVKKRRSANNERMAEREETMEEVEDRKETERQDLNDGSIAEAENSDTNRGYSLKINYNQPKEPEKEKKAMRKIYRKVGNEMIEKTGEQTTLNEIDAFDIGIDEIIGASRSVSNVYSLFPLTTSKLSLII